ncbi:hypothetical protein [Mesorhizobium captivum]|uniref:hypothetical protein n=1 Tax=Mesorhizobium captivum TaxID=3072319 RepID=UPI002A24197E|nr:hypothetical protein [Mesorhizobium sp. VK3C]MDX8451094.1 hypothetical protein [Mesorhizobium sp. VK3C]
MRVISWFQHVRRAAGISCPIGEPRSPRLHDIRHTAAVHRVIAWYRSGQDVQRLLPQLATYLGHIDIRSTQRYTINAALSAHDAGSPRCSQPALCAIRNGGQP